MLPASLKLANLPAARDELLACSSETGRVLVDGSEVSQVDTAGLQMLISLKVGVEADSLDWELSLQNPTLLKAARSLGIGKDAFRLHRAEHQASLTPEHREKYLGLFHQEFEELIRTARETLDGEILKPGDLAGLLRIFHTIKGSAAAFGFPSLSTFAHLLEDRLVPFRDEGRSLNAQELSQLKAVVHELAGIGSSLYHEDETKAFLLGVGDRFLLGPKPEPPGGDWTIKFFPRSLARGGDPMMVFRALAGVSRFIPRPDLTGVPALSELELERCYISWHLRLRSKVGRADLEEILRWADPEGVLEIQSGIETLDVTTLRRRRPPVLLRIPAREYDRVLYSAAQVILTQFEIVSRPEVAKLAGEAVGRLGQATRELWDDLLNLRTLPLELVLTPMGIEVGRLASRLNKKVQFRLDTAEVSVGQHLAEVVSEACLHLIRNSIDHGLETPEERVAAGKPETGRIKVKALETPGWLHLTIRDDGRGIDEIKVRNRARELGLDPNQELLDLLCFAGLSTTTVTTQVSGRGVGMDSVRRSVQSAGGRVSLEYETGKGTTFHLSLPLQAFLQSGYLVRCRNEYFMVLGYDVAEVVKPAPVSSADGTCQIGEQVLPRIELGEWMELDPAGSEAGGALRLLVDGIEAVLVVDEVLTYRRFVVVSLEATGRSIPGILGVTPTAEGHLLLVVNCRELPVSRTLPEGTFAGLNENEKSEDLTGPLKWLGFKAGGSGYCVSESRVLAVVPAPPMRRLPRRPPGLKGVTVVRGLLVSVYDLDELLELDGPEEKPFLVVLEAEQGGIMTPVGVLLKEEPRPRSDKCDKADEIEDLLDLIFGDRF